MDDFGNALSGTCVQNEFGYAVFAVTVDEQLQRSVSANPYGGFNEDGFCSYVI